MIEEPAVAQARLLLDALHEHVAEISEKLQGAERKNRNLRSMGTVSDQRRTAELRRDLYEAYRLIEGLHKRFPEVRPAPTARLSRPESRRPVARQPVRPTRA
jgi:predicted  nucleic acid-binding Zn-ribbon protein